MGWISALFSNSGDAIAKPIDSVGTALDKVFTSDDERLSHAEIMEKLQQTLPQLTAELDQSNAKSSIPFVQMARPLCVYIAGFNFVQLGVAVIWCNKSSTIPEWFISSSVEAFLGALGLYGLGRTIEKIKGVSK